MPPESVTVMSTVDSAVPGGDVTVIVVGLVTTAALAATDPNQTVSTESPA